MYQDQACEVIPPPFPPMMALPAGGRRHQFMAWLPQGIAGPKVAGFVAEHEAQVLHVGPDELRLQIGRKRWFPWTRGAEALPIEMTITTNPETNCTRSLTHVIVDLRPLNEHAEAQQQEQRMNEIVCALRHRLMAQELELAPLESRL